MKNVRLFNWAKGKEKGENENFHFGRRNVERNENERVGVARTDNSIPR